MGSGIFGIGFQEMVIVGVLFLIIFGPSKLPQMARDLGKFVNQARQSIDEFKSELMVDGEENQEAEDQRSQRRRRSIEKKTRR